MIDVWECSEYVLDFEYARVLNMLGLYRVLCELYYNIHGILNVLGSEYANVFNVPEV